MAALAVAAAALLAACGSSSTGSGTATSQTATTPTNSASVAAVAGNPPAAASGPGLGKPPVTIGDKNFTEEYILGSLYAQALAAKGYKVTVKGNIGSSEITYKALKSGQIDMYPEYTGTLLTAVAGITTPPKSAADAYTQAKAWAEQHGFTLLDKTPFYDSDALGTLKSYASQHHLTTIADLKPLGSSVKLGGAPEFATREEGLVGLKKEYGINPTFSPLAIGLTYKALDTGQVQVSDVFTTDPQLTTNKYKVLTDPKFVFGFQNVAPIVSKKVVAAEGPEFAATLNKVSALLTIPAIQKMNAAVALDQQPYPQVAREFLQANGLL
ncbi:MAG TPA: glycine betaine ABC transporter substrate-binding protein [Solirubrobacteraceae bacterium]